MGKVQFSFLVFLMSLFQGFCCIYYLLLHVLHIRNDIFLEVCHVYMDS